MRTYGKKGRKNEAGGNARKTVLMGAPGKDRKRERRKKEDSRS